MRYISISFYYSVFNSSQINADRFNLPGIKIWPKEDQAVDSCLQGTLQTFQEETNSQVKQISDDSSMENESKPLLSILSKDLKLVIDGGAELDVFLAEEEFDDDILPEENMESRNSEIEFFYFCSPFSSVRPKRNLKKIGVSITSNQNLDTAFYNPLNELHNNDFALGEILALNTRLGDLIRSCRNMSSELKGILRDMNLSNIGKI